ncbi:MAG TPA: hypothetical protein VJR58_14760 [Vineibacter sp.]|nr:hypothetical protein [Vineibacter sp.]
MTQSGYPGPRGSRRAHAFFAAGGRARQEPRGPVALSCLALLVLLSSPVSAQSSDGAWVGRAEAAGSCASLEVRITIESGLLDGTASEPDTAAPRVQGKKGEQLPAPPALWQLNGRVGANGAVDIIGLRAMRERERERSKWSGRADAGTLRISETDGPCRRTATLTRSR